jgi:Leucine-rich repeat (LRR) protein
MWMLLVGLMLVAATVGCSGEQEAAVAEIEKLGGKVTDTRPVVNVDLTGTQETDAGLEHVKGLTSLESLRLGRSKVSDAGLANLKELTNLQWLDLTDTQITNAGLEHLKGLTKLRSLNLQGTQITDEGLDHLNAFTSLQKLNLSGTKITGPGLKRLKGLSSLRSLALHQIEHGASHAVVADLQKALPKLDVSH